MQDSHRHLGVAWVYTEIQQHAGDSIEAANLSRHGFVVKTLLMQTSISDSNTNSHFSKIKKLFITFLKSFLFGFNASSFN
ncbi:hypothetical protein [Pelagibaculum spongiae]|uniref:Uncharacterized protein n=1 Tax=Pelagibaculum spongiae TaxID=2080658 RepID=A0A2V1H5J3_9GAMM|nr:hypothetical protein [Pelagibaculum spongiae]PVZ71692.1 hypothetical protein DC094_01295 [Pelagibaculum spongiae]